MSQSSTWIVNATANLRVVTTQDSLKSAGDDVMSATNALESDLKDLGEPDTQSGQEAKDSIDQLSRDLNTDSDAIKTAVDGVSDLSGVPSATATVSSTLATVQSQVTSTVNSLKQLDAQGELQTAFQPSSASSSSPARASDLSPRHRTQTGLGA